MNLSINSVDDLFIDQKANDSLEPFFKILSTINAIILIKL